MASKRAGYQNIPRVWAFKSGCELRYEAVDSRIISVSNIDAPRRRATRQALQRRLSTRSTSLQLPNNLILQRFKRFGVI
jgi:hypothetical protein